jgi:hypothetical protein
MKILFFVTVLLQIIHCEFSTEPKVLDKKLNHLIKKIENSSPEIEFVYKNSELRILEINSSIQDSKKRILLNSKFEVFQNNQKILEIISNQSGQLIGKLELKDTNQNQIDVRVSIDGISTKPIFISLHSEPSLILIKNINLPLEIPNESNLTAYIHSNELNLDSSLFLILTIIFILLLLYLRRKFIIA